MLTFIRTLATSALFAIAAMSANAVTVDLNDLSLGNGTNIETGAPGFGDDGPVTLNWNPTGNPSRTLVFWNGLIRAATQPIAVGSIALWT